MNEERTFITQNLHLAAYLLATKSLDFLGVVPVERRLNRVYFSFADPRELAAQLELSMASAEVPVSRLFAALKYLKRLMNVAIDERHISAFGF